MRLIKSISLLCVMSLWQLDAMEEEEKKFVPIKGYEHITPTVFTQKGREIVNLVQMRTEQAQSTKKLDIKWFTFNSFPHHFKELPFEINAFIFDMTIPTDNLQQAAKAINQLTLLCKSMNKSINNKRNTLTLIKCLSQAFEWSNIESAEILQTSTANMYFIRQKMFESILENKEKNTSISLRDASFFRKNYINIDFTYQYGTLLQRAATPFCTTKRKPLIAKWLIEQGADFTKASKDEIPIILQLMKDLSESATEICSYIFQSPGFDINRYYFSNPDIEDSRTTLLMFLISAQADALLDKDKEYNLVLQRIKLLLEKGADPESKHMLETTPLFLALTAAQYTGDQTIVKMMQKAIAKKQTHNKPVHKKSTPKKTIQKVSSQKQHVPKKPHKQAEKESHAIE